MRCLALQPDFSRQVVLKLKPKILKKIKKIGMIFDIENSPTLGFWLLLQDLLKNWSVKGVASDFNDFNLQGWRLICVPAISVFWNLKNCFTTICNFSRIFGFHK